MHIENDNYEIFWVTFEDAIRADVAEPHKGPHGRVDRCPDG